MKHPTRKAIDKFNKLFGLIELEHMQDWEIECSNPDRVTEFIDYYSLLEDDDEKFTLMALILGSYEEFHAPNKMNIEIWNKIENILIRDRVLLIDHIEYYSCLEINNEDEWFPITPLIRKVCLK